MSDEERRTDGGDPVDECREDSLREGRDALDRDEGVREEEGAGGEEAGPESLADLLMPAAVAFLVVGAAFGVLLVPLTAAPVIGTAAGLFVVLMVSALLVNRSFARGERWWLVARRSKVAYAVYGVCVAGGLVAAAVALRQHRVLFGVLCSVGLAVPLLAWLSVGAWQKWGYLRFLGWVACAGAVLLYAAPWPFNGGLGYQLSLPRCSACWRHSIKTRRFFWQGEVVPLKFCSVHVEKQPPIQPPSRRVPAMPVESMPEMYLWDYWYHTPVRVASIVLGVGLVVGCWRLWVAIDRGGKRASIGAGVLFVVMLLLTLFGF